MVRPPGLGPGGNREAWRLRFPVRFERFGCRSRAGYSGMDVRPRRVCGASDALRRPLRQDGGIIGLGGPLGGGAESASVAIIEPPAFRLIEGFSRPESGRPSCRKGKLRFEGRRRRRKPYATIGADRGSWSCSQGEALGPTIGAPTWPDLPRETRLALGADGAAAYRRCRPERGPLRDGGRS